MRQRRSGTSAPTRVLVVYAHPAADGFIPEARVRVLAGLDAAAAEIRVHDLHGDGFVPELSADEHARHLEPGVTPDLDRYADDVRWCETLLFVYPTWWSGQPAILKGWMDRLLTSGVAWELPPDANRLRPRLRNVRRIIAVTSHGSAKHMNILQGEGGKRTLFRSVRAMCHPLTRCHWIAYYGIDADDRERQDAFLASLPQRIAKLTG